MPAKSNNILFHTLKLKWPEDDNTKLEIQQGRNLSLLAQEDVPHCQYRLVVLRRCAFQFAYLRIEALMHIMRDLGRVSPPQQY